MLYEKRNNSSMSKANGPRKNKQERRGNLEREMNLLAKSLIMKAKTPAVG